MRTLFLDLASHDGRIACVGEKRTESSASVDHRLSDNELLPILEKALAAAGWKERDIERVACVAGPGGFTSLRVAVAFANAISYALNVPACGVHLSDLYAARVSGSFLWLHSTKRKELFVRGFGNLKDRFPDAVCVPLEDLLKELPEDLSWTGELIPEHQKEIAGAGAKAMDPASLEEVLPGFLSALPYARKTIVPWYGRSW